MNGNPHLLRHTAKTEQENREDIFRRRLPSLSAEIRGRRCTSRTPKASNTGDIQTEPEQNPR